MRSCGQRHKTQQSWKPVLAQDLLPYLHGRDTPFLGSFARRNANASARLASREAMVVTDGSYAKPSLDPEATVMEFGGSSPPRPPSAVPISIIRCVRGHSLTDPADYFLADSGTWKTCARCRLTYLERWAAWVEANREAEAQRIAADKARRAAERQERMEARRATRRMLLAARTAGIVRRHLRRGVA